MRVGCLHYELTEDVAANRERLLEGLETALSEADLAVGPETATVYVEEGASPGPSRHRQHAESIDGETVTRAQRIVDREGGVAVFGLPERADGTWYNAAVVLEADRPPRVHRQPNPPGFPEHGWVTGYGPLEVSPLETAVGTIQPVVCALLPDRVSSISSSVEGGTNIDVVVVPANWREDEPEYRGSDYVSLVERWARLSAEISVPILVSNAYRSTELGWPAAIVADGEILARSDEPGDVVFATL